MGMDFTPKQLAFIEQDPVDLNATLAATRAGYSAKTAKVAGSRLLSNVNVMREITKKLTKVSDRAEITQEYVLQTIVDTMERCKQSKPVVDKKGKPVLVETPEGEMVPAYTFNAAGVFKGAELLGRHIGMFGDNKVLNIVPEKVSHKELARNILTALAAMVEDRKQIEHDNLSNRITTHI